MVQQMTLQFPDWEQGNFVGVQHQKLTASQLIHFIRSSSDTESLVKVTFFKGKSFMSPQHQGATGEKVAEEESKLPVSIRKQQFPSLVPVFKRKPNRPDGSPIYSCIVASKCELWDVADIFTEDACFLLERPLEQEEPPVNCCSKSYFEVLGVSQQGPSSTCLSQLSSNMNHNAPSMMQVQKNRNSTAFRIPEFRIRKFEEMEVIVSHLVSPSDFSIQHVSSELQKLSHLMGSLKSHSSLAQMNCVPDIGSCVAGWYPEHQLWCRAQVLRICGMQAETSQTVEEGESTGVYGGHIELELRRIDFGDTARLPLYHLRELDEQMAAVPQQALQVALANVSPSSGTEWTPDAVSWFKGKVMGRVLYARLYPQRKNVRIELFLEKGKIGAMRRGSPLSLQLAQNGHAHHDDLKRSKGSVPQKAGGKASQWERRLMSCCSQNGRV
ncbi:hypothetical protein GJAV_G00205030 [Gymnothorax javanicus]|nr:hypothetical protein GJAV_G00205030 [Gymnothorax javanicus]